MGEGSLELKSYARLFLGWWWLFALSASGAGAAAYIVSGSGTPEYEASVKILVERHQLPGVPTPGDLAVSQDLARSYVDLIKLRPVLSDVASSLPVDYGPGQVAGSIRVTSSRNIIEITARDSDPMLAAIIANTTAETFIRTLQDRQLSQLARFQEMLAQYGIEQDSSIVSAQAAMLGVLSIVEPAIPSSRPVNESNTGRNAALAVMLGLIVSGLGVLAIGYLDDRVKTPEHLKTITGVAALGSVPRFKADNGQGIDAALGNSHLIEAYRFILTNLDFKSGNTSPLKAILVTSPGMGEGKTTTAVNLAAVAARQGKYVILVDTDARSSSLRSVFGINGERGFNDLLRGEATLDEVLSPTQIDSLYVVPAGTQNSPSISSSRLRDAIQRLKSRADLVIFDSPPLLALTDAVVLASLTDGVLMVVDASKTSREALEQATERLQQASAHVAGVVFNKTRNGGPEGHYYTGGDKTFTLRNLLSGIRHRA